MLSDHNNGKNKPTVNNQCLFSVSLISFRLSSDAATGEHEIRLMESHSRRKSTESGPGGDGCDGIILFGHTRRALMDFSLPPYEVLEPFFFLVYRHSHALFFCVCSHFSSCVFCCFSFGFHLDFPLSHSWHFCFDVVWIVPVLCLKSRVQCLQVEFEPSSSPRLWSDGVCVSSKSLLLLNVESVAFVQGTFWHQCNCTKCELRRCSRWQVITTMVLLIDCFH